MQGVISLQKKLKNSTESLTQNAHIIIVPPPKQWPNQSMHQTCKMYTQTMLQH